MREIKLKIETSDNKTYFTKINADDFTQVFTKINRDIQENKNGFAIFNHLAIRLNKIDTISVIDDERLIPEGVKVTTSPERALSREQTENLIKACEMFVNRQFKF